MPEDACRLFLITPVIRDAAAFLPVFEAALEAGDVACVLLRQNAPDEGEAKKIIRALAAPAQQRGVACLIEGDARLALHTEVDGVHVDFGGEALDSALKQLKPQRIVGASGLMTRDDAMVAGEAGVDYLMFGGPQADETADSIVERVAWWADIFNVPCVGYAHSLTEAAALVQAGADFVAVCDALWEDPRGVGPVLKDLSQILAKTRQAAQ
ncbi:thiamine phosphate synthase [Methyloferula stellata]|uniref:thiamine phosphate synthase n=1 Tax=Methyloferula stellata TaxID=876270 RepID=UPI0003803EC9|nr:thiamine phosphate synthase [Methyloferula stellata]